jgi:antibiotic biosynthesis monooxygenase (ABM) superfamily enzyme
VPRWAIDLLIMAGAFAVVTALAELLGATNLGTAMAFGQMGFALAVVYVLVRR